MNSAFVAKYFGQTVDLGTCLVGQNLNVLCLRGFAGLQSLAAVSDADVFDQELNPHGTQRDIKKAHARECLTYARQAIEDAPEDYPRFFPEVLLNVRTMNVVEIYDPEDPARLLDINSYSPVDTAPARVGVRILLKDYEWPKILKAPHISRVDGNHRLYGTDEFLNAAAKEETEWSADDFPQVSFCLLVGLKAIDEARLFRDINGEHKGMETAHLIGLEFRTKNVDEMKFDENLKPNWLAHELSSAGRAFQNVVFMGGSKAGVKEALGGVPPIKINSLKSTIDMQLKSSTTVSTALSDDPDTLLEILNNYWLAVSETFPEAWADRKNYILLQAIGLGGFAKFGGYIIDRAFEDNALTKEDFKSYLLPVRKKLELKRTDFEGIAGAGGQSHIAKQLIEACEDLAVKAEKAKKALGKRAEIDSALGR